MIEIIKGRIDWMDQCNNFPTLRVMLSRIPASAEHVYEKRAVPGGHVYYSEVEGVASFFSWSGRPDHGYGGRAFELKMKDGSMETLVGPWSSSASSVSGIGLGPCVEVSMTDEEDVWQKGYTYYAGSITMELLGRYRDRIEVPPFRFVPEEPWKCYNGFTHQMVFPEGSRFTMLEAEGVIKAHMEASGEQAAALGYTPRLTPIVELPDGTYWVKPRSWHVPMNIPKCVRVEELTRPEKGHTHMRYGRHP